MRDAHRHPRVLAVMAQQGGVITTVHDMTSDVPAWFVYRFRDARGRVFHALRGGGVGHLLFAAPAAAACVS